MQPLSAPLHSSPGTALQPVRPGFAATAASPQPQAAHKLLSPLRTGTKRGVSGVCSARDGDSQRECDERQKKDLFFEEDQAYFRQLQGDIDSFATKINAHNAGAAVLGSVFLYQLAISAGMLNQADLPLHTVLVEAGRWDGCPKPESLALLMEVTVASWLLWRRQLSIAFRKVLCRDRELMQAGFNAKWVRESRLETFGIQPTAFQSDVEEQQWWDDFLAAADQLPQERLSTEAQEKMQQERASMMVTSGMSEGVDAMRQLPSWLPWSLWLLAQLRVGHMVDTDSFVGGLLEFIPHEHVLPAVCILLLMHSFSPIPPMMARFLTSDLKARRCLVTLLRSGMPVVKAEYTAEQYRRLLQRCNKRLLIRENLVDLGYK